MRISDWSSDVCSSDLLKVADRRFDLALTFLGGVIFGIFRKIAMRARFLDRIDDQGSLGLERRELGIHRSEEHTSELQSLMRISYAVFCLNKKKRVVLYSTLHSSSLDYVVRSLYT